MEPVSQIELPDHNDYGEPCTHREAYEAILAQGKHTRVQPFAALQPDSFVCLECSDAVQEWVEWPCEGWKKRAVDFDTPMKKFWHRWFGVGWPSPEDIPALQEDLWKEAFEK
jgi:hypothetical protein